MKNMFLSEEMLLKKTPQQLTALLYEACERNLEEAVSSMEQKHFTEANQKCQRAIEIIERLGAGLNYEAGVVADELDALYNYMNEQLIAANYEKNIETARHVLHLLQRIASSWNEALQTQTDTLGRLAKKQANAYEKQFHYGK
ncbi:flagellar export chaperone FliS [Salibacterium aidingense]|uniref:flagellar export chaperone FliS n=1 Tax=Salibacterium aidingense TaxID=384933 RepID=UPI003BD88590